MPAAQLVVAVRVRLDVPAVRLVVDPDGRGDWRRRHRLLHEAREADGAERLEHAADLRGGARQVAGGVGRRRVLGPGDVGVELEQGLLELRRVAGELGQHLLQQLQVERVGLDVRPHVLGDEVHVACDLVGHPVAEVQVVERQAVVDGEQALLGRPAEGREVAGPAHS